MPALEKARVISSTFLEDGSGKKFTVFMGKSNLVRPEYDYLAQGSIWIDTDTKKSYYYDEENGWPERS